jgi:serine O-acetyltransferase
MKAYEKVIHELGDIQKFEPLYHEAMHNTPMPSRSELEKLLDLLMEIMFLGYFGNNDITPETANYYIGANIDKIQKILLEQIRRGLCFDCENPKMKCKDCVSGAAEMVNTFIHNLPNIKRSLSTDVIAAYNGDPAAKSYGETIICYPSVICLTHYRIAHELYKLNVPIIPRIISELAHSKTNIEIHPGAEIGDYFFIDHGTGVVIGETSIIGKNVRIYQGVTLGAKSFPLDEHGKPIKGIARHPIVEDDVIIYSNATILGRIRVGKGAVVGGNRWVTRDVAAGEKVLS